MEQLQREILLVLLKMMKEEGRIGESVFFRAAERIQTEPELPKFLRPLPLEFSVEGDQTI